MDTTTCIGCIEKQPNQLAHMDEGGCLYDFNEDKWGVNDYDLAYEEELQNLSNATTNVNSNNNNDSDDSESGEDYEYIELDGAMPTILQNQELTKMTNAIEKINELKNVIKTMFCDDYINEIKHELMELLKFMDK